MTFFFSSICILGYKFPIKYNCSWFTCILTYYIFVILFQMCSNFHWAFFFWSNKLFKNAWGWGREFACYCLIIHFANSALVREHSGWNLFTCFMAHRTIYFSESSMWPCRNIFWHYITWYIQIYSFYIFLVEWAFYNYEMFFLICSHSWIQVSYALLWI